MLRIEELISIGMIKFFFAYSCLHSIIGMWFENTTSPRKARNNCWWPKYINIDITNAVRNVNLQGIVREKPNFKKPNGLRILEEINIVNNLKQKQFEAESWWSPSMICLRFWPKLRSISQYEWVFSACA